MQKTNDRGTLVQPVYLYMRYNKQVSMHDKVSLVCISGLNFILLFCPVKKV